MTARARRFVLSVLAAMVVAASIAYQFKFPVPASKRFVPEANETAGVLLSSARRCLVCAHVSGELNLTLSVESPAVGVTVWVQKGMAGNSPVPRLVGVDDVKHMAAATWQRALPEDGLYCAFARANLADGQRVLVGLTLSVEFMADQTALPVFAFVMAIEMVAGVLVSSLCARHALKTKAKVS